MHLPPTTPPPDWQGCASGRVVVVAEGEALDRVPPRGSGNVLPAVREPEHPEQRLRLRAHHRVLERRRREVGHLHRHGEPSVRHRRAVEEVDLRADRDRLVVGRRLVRARRVGRHDARCRHGVERECVAGRIGRRRADDRAVRADGAAAERRPAVLRYGHGRRDMPGFLVRLLVRPVEDDRGLAGDRVVVDGEEVRHRAVSRRDRQVATEPVEADRVVVERVRRRLDLAERGSRRQRVGRDVPVDVPAGLEVAAVRVALRLGAREHERDATGGPAGGEPWEDGRAHGVTVDLDARAPKRADALLRRRHGGRRRGGRQVALLELRLRDRLHVRVEGAAVAVADVDVPGAVVVRRDEAGHLARDEVRDAHLPRQPAVPRDREVDEVAGLAVERAGGIPAEVDEVTRVVVAHRPWEERARRGDDRGRRIEREPLVGRAQHDRVSRRRVVVGQ